MEKANFFELFSNSLRQYQQGMFRLWLVLVCAHFISLLLGFAIFLIVFGVQIAATRIIIYWTPARNWLARTFHLTMPQYNISKTSPLYKSLVNIYHLIIALFFLAIGVYVIKMGFGILLRDGFLGQNFVYLILFREK